MLVFGSTESSGVEKFGVASIWSTSAALNVLVREAEEAKSPFPLLYVAGFLIGLSASNKISIEPGESAKLSVDSEVVVVTLSVGNVLVEASNENAVVGV